MKSKQITTAGRTIETEPANGKTFSLEELQKAVGGYIEFIYLPDNQIMVINEEGKLNKLDYNLQATRMVKENASRQGLFFNDFICGNVLVCDRSQIE